MSQPFLDLVIIVGLSSFILGLIVGILLARPRIIQRIPDQL